MSQKETIRRVLSYIRRYTFFLICSLVLAAVTVGGSLLGLVGMVVSVPLAAVVYTLLRQDLRSRTPAPAPAEPPEDPQS